MKSLRFFLTKCPRHSFKLVAVTRSKKKKKKKNKKKRKMNERNFWKKLKD